MKAFYIPTALISVTEKIVIDHPKAGQVILPLSTSDLKALVLAIDAKELAALPAFARMLSLRQRTALCAYLPLNTYQVSLEKIVKVLSGSMTVALFQTLFDVWQNAPDCFQVLSLLGETAKDTTYQSCLSVDNEFVVAWSQSSMPLYAVALTCRDRGTGPNFLARFISMGFSDQKPLAIACFDAFLQHASLETFQTEGDDSVQTLLGNISASEQSKVLLRLLHCCETNHDALLPFYHVYNYAYRLWGEPNVARFTQDGQALFDLYRWWYYYRQMERSFCGDRRRIVFWKQYLHLCTNVQRDLTHAMLIMHFPNSVVTEFETMGPVYIFDKPYYDGTVTVYIRKYKTPQLKSWLYNTAVACSRQTHMANWEWKQTVALRANHII